MKRVALVFAMGLAGSAFAAQAYLVHQAMGRSVTGQPILVCTYQYGRQQFEKYFPTGSSCPQSVEVQ